MTPEQHRRLDAMVAEKVMEWGKSRHFPEQDSSAVPSLRRLDGWSVWKAGKWEFLPHFSEDMNAAMEAVEKLREKYVVLITLWPRSCEVEVFNREGENAVSEAFGTELPRTISLAALKALGVDVSEFERG